MMAASGCVVCVAGWAGDNGKAGFFDADTDTDTNADSDSDTEARYTYLLFDTNYS